MRKGIYEKIEALVTVKGTDEADDFFPGKILFFFQSLIRRAKFKIIWIYAIKNRCNLLRRNSSVCKIVFKAITKGPQLGQLFYKPRFRQILSVYISMILSAATSALYRPRVFDVANNCLLRFEDS